MGTVALNGQTKITPRASTFGLVSLSLLTVTASGYIRDALLAQRFGASAAMDAYVAAFFIPNLLYLVLITGALSPVFIPLFSEYRHRDPAEAFRVFSIVANFSALALIIIVGVLSCTARLWLRVLFSGFSETELALALKLYYIIAPSIVFLGIAGLFSALLNGLNHFFVSSLAPLAYSLSVIVSLPFARGDKAMYWVAVATAVGLATQLFVQIPIAVRRGLKYQFVFDYRHPVLRRLIPLTLPLLLYLLVAYGSVLVERHLASKASVGAVSGFNYATRLFAIPFNLLGAPLALISFPDFSMEAVKPNLGNLGPKIRTALRLTVFVFIPTSLWMILHSLSLTRCVLERGQFSLADAKLTSGVLAWYSLGILPNAMAVILLRGFYAVQDMMTPLWAECINFIFYLSAAPYLTRSHGLRGLACARAISFFLVAIVLLFSLNKKLRIIGSRPQVLVLKVIVASAALAFVSSLLFTTASSVFQSHGFVVRLFVLAGDSSVSALTYLCICKLWRVPEATATVEVISTWCMRINNRNPLHAGSV